MRLAKPGPKASIVLGLVGVVVASMLSVALGNSVGAVSASSGQASAAVYTKTVSRINLVDGQDVVVERRNITLKVDRTADLKDRQSIGISWTGAHPTANISLDPNADVAVHAEYPMVILQCRGEDSDSTPAALRISPTTCWSPYDGSRLQRNGATNSPTLDVGSFPAWRLDRYAALADRQQYSQLPSPATATCPAANLVAEHALPFIAASGTAYYGSGNTTPCGGAPPEAATNSDANAVSSLPDNATFSRTQLDGSGSVSFNVRDAQTNASLGCSAVVACTIVAIPIMGISCDGGAGLPADQRPTNTPDDSNDIVTNSEQQCEATGQYAPGSQLTAGAAEDYSVSGQLWWSASNWRNRISIPVQFAAADNACGLTSSKTPVLVYGSELLTQATSQWSGQLCAGTYTTPFKHIQTSEPQARQLLSVKSVEAVFGSDPPAAGFSTPTVQAPVAVSGFAVSYVIDDKNGNPYTSLRLTPRLLAKLMTESYPASGLLKQVYRYSNIKGQDDPIAANSLADNPQDITYDPEFIALNPGIGHLDNFDGGRDALLSLGTNSDVIHALTSYIAADPEASAWVGGKPDPWGMVVNPNYQGISLPVYSWPLLDTFIVPPSGSDAECAALRPQTPVLPRIAAPLSRLIDIAQSIQFGLPGGLTGCSTVADPDGNLFSRVVRSSKQQIGRRFVIGLTSLGDADRFGLSTAALQTHTSADAPALFVDGTGRSFVAPTDGTLAQAASLLTYDATTQTWPIPYTSLRTDSKGIQAYPGTMVVYADVPLTGLSHADAIGYANLVYFAAGIGQTPGGSVGQLAVGFVPMTKANNLAVLAEYSKRAAISIANQTGQVPPLVLLPVTTPTSSSPSASTAVNTPASSTTDPVDSATPQASPSSSPTPRSSSSAAPSAIETPALRATGFTRGQPVPIAQWLLYLLILLLLIGPVGSPALLLALRYRRRR